MCLVFPVFATGAAFAQDADGPSTLFIDVALGLSYEQDRDQDDEFETTVDLGAGYFTSTHNQRLSFELGVTAQALDGNYDLTDPFLAVAYAHFTRNTEISADVTYREAEVTGFTLDPDFESDDLIRQEGSEQNIRYGLGLVTGRASPFGTDTQLRYSERNFSGGATDDDEVVHSVESTLRFTIDPRIELTLTGFWREEDTDDAVNTLETTERVTAGATLAIDQVWSAEASLGYSRVETHTDIDRDIREGHIGSLSLTRDLRNGALTFSSNLVQADEGWRNSLRVRRVIETASGDMFNASLGQIFFEEGGSGHLASLVYMRTVRSGSLSLDFDYTSNLDDDEQMVHRTQLEAAMRQNLTENSSWSLNGAIASVAYDNPATIDATRVEVGLGYRHALSNDWDLSAQVDHRILYEDGDLEDRTNVLSLGLERRFSRRP